MLSSSSQIQDKVSAAEPQSSQATTSGNGELSEQGSQIQSLHSQLQSALEEIDKLRQRALAESQSHQSLSGLEGDPFEEGNIWRPAWDGFRRGFVLAYGIRAGLGTMTRALALYKEGKYQDMRGWRLVSERGLQYREDAVRLGLFVGGFTGSYHLVSGALKRWQGDLTPAQNCMAAGTAAGLTLLFLSKERRRTLALYMLARIAQCVYNSLKQQGLFHFWGSKWGYGDALLFALSSAQVMYAYVMRPETLPKSYWKFIVKTGPVEAPALEAVRRSIRKLPIDLQAFNAFIRRRGGRAFLGTPYPKQITDAMIHPQTASALLHNVKVPCNTFRKTFPLYMSISLVPYVVLNLKRALRDVFGTAGHAIGSAVRSTSFLAAFVGLYSSTISLHRKLFSGDHKLVYYVAGLVASGSILIEKKSRRSELALYVMPRAVDSFVLALTKRRWVPSVKFGEVILFSLCMGGLMYYRQHEPDTMAPLLNTLIGRIVFGQTKSRRTDLSRPASFAFSEGDFPGGHQQHGSYASQPSSLGSSPTKAGAPLPAGHQHSGYASHPSSMGSSTTAAHVPGSSLGNLTESRVASGTDRSRNGHAPEVKPSLQQTGQGTSELPSAAHRRQEATPSGRESLQSGTQGVAKQQETPTATDTQDVALGQHNNSRVSENESSPATSAERTNDALSTAASNRQADANLSDANQQAAPDPDQSAQNGQETVVNSNFADLVQGTEQFIDMLSARDLS